MNPLPADFDLAPLIGAKLLQVCLGQYQIQLHFEKTDLTCHIEGGGKVSLEANGQLSELFHRAWKDSRGLERFVGMQVTSWSRRSDHHFVLVFTSEAALVFETKEGPYEDFTVMLGEKAFWVL